MPVGVKRARASPGKLIVFIVLERRLLVNLIQISMQEIQISMQEIQISMQERIFT